MNQIIDVKKDTLYSYYTLPNCSWYLNNIWDLVAKFKCFCYVLNLSGNALWSQKSFVCLFLTLNFTDTRPLSLAMIGRPTVIWDRKWPRSRYFEDWGWYFILASYIYLFILLTILLFFKFPLLSCLCQHVSYSFKFPYWNSAYLMRLWTSSWKMALECKIIN